MYSFEHQGRRYGTPNTSGVHIMKTAFITLALSTTLAACGHGRDDHTPQEPIKVEEQSPYNSPMNEQTGVPFAVPFAYEAPIDPVQMKYLNVGVARAIAEYKMVGEILKTDLAAEMGEGVDAWIKKDVTRCIASTAETFINQNDWNYYQSSAMCMGWAYGNWALVNGTAGTEGTLGQCLERGYCGFLFKEYDLTPPEVPFINTTGGLDETEDDGIMMPSTTDQMGF